MQIISAQEVDEFWLKAKVNGRNLSITTKFGHATGTKTEKLTADEALILKIRSEYKEANAVVTTHRTSDEKVTGRAVFIEGLSHNDSSLA